MRKIIILVMMAVLMTGCATFNEDSIKSKAGATHLRFEKGDVKLDAWNAKEYDEIEVRIKKEKDGGYDARWKGKKVKAFEAQSDALKAMAETNKAIADTVNNLVDKAEAAFSKRPIEDGVVTTDTVDDENN